MPIRWRLTLFIALVIGAILLLLGFSLFFLLREALLSNVEDIAQSRAFSAARAVESEGEMDEVEQFTLDAVVVIVRDADGHVLQTVNLPAERGAHDVVWRQALGSGEPASGTARFAGGDPYYVHAVLVAPSEGRARVVEAG